MARKVNVSAQDNKDRSGTTFGPLPAGKALFNIYDIKPGEYKNGVNKGKPNLNIQFQVAAGQPRANARLFELMGDFPRWEPKKPGEKGALNFLFHPFYEALGVEFPEDGGEVELPEIEEMIGEQIGIDLKIIPDTYRYRKAITEWTEERESVQEKAEAKGKDVDEALDKWEKKNPEPKQEDFKTNAVKSYFPAEDFDPEDAEVGGQDDDEFDL
jgi:hypothetical protein